MGQDVLFETLKFFASWVCAVMGQTGNEAMTVALEACCGSKDPADDPGPYKAAQCGAQHLYCIVRQD